MPDSILSQILTNIDHWVWCKDINGVYQYANASFCRDTGLSCDDIIGKTDFDLWDEASAQHFFNRDQEVVKSKVPIRVKEYTPGTHAARKYVETIKFPIFNGDGDVIATCGIARDIQWEHDLQTFVQQAVTDLETIVQEGK